MTTEFEKMEEPNRQSNKDLFLGMFYEKILRRKKLKIKFVRAKKIEYLPTLLSQEEILKRIQNISIIYKIYLN